MRRSTRSAFLGAALPLFAAGCLAGFLLFPRMVALLASFADSADSTLLQASYYVDFVLKIVLATGIAAVIIGPHRMPQYAQSAARLIRTIAGAVAASRSRAEEIVGSAIPTEDWKKLDPRQ